MALLSFFDDQTSTCGLVLHHFPKNDEVVVNVIHAPTTPIVVVVSAQVKLTLHFVSLGVAVFVEPPSLLLAIVKAS